MQMRIEYRMRDKNKVQRNRLKNLRSIIQSNKINLSVNRKKPKPLFNPKLGYNSCFTMRVLRLQTVKPRILSRK